MLKKIVLGALLIIGLANANLVEERDYKGKETIFVYENDTRSEFMVENDTGLIKTGKVLFYDNMGRVAVKLECNWTTPNPETLICKYNRTFEKK